MSDHPRSKALVERRPRSTALTAVLLGLLGLALLISNHGSLIARQIPILLAGMVILAAFFYARQYSRQQRERHREEVGRLKSCDALTGLANRQLFLSGLHTRLRTAENQSKPFALLLLDIDRFKELDTILGTENGDLLLQEFAKRLRHFQNDEALVARLSGNEFAIILDDSNQQESFQAQLNALHLYIKRPVRFHNRPIDISVSGGFALFPDHGYKVTALLQQAKLALLRAKQEGRDQICRFEMRQDVRAHIDHELSQEMGKSIARGEFQLHYQPQYDMRCGDLVGFEALMRWKHPTRGWIAPDKFISIAERNGHILPLSDFALREACSRAASWARPLKVAVNLSPIQFKKSNLVEQIEQILKQTGLPAHRLEIEVTEGLFIQSSQRVTDILSKLRHLGVSVALDDFGTGYSSLSYLSAFPIDKIKIDRSFVRDLISNNGNMAIISAMIGIGKSLDMRITAEGIEDEATLDLLRIAGCHEAQGYFLGKPRDLDMHPGEEMEPYPDNRLVGPTEQIFDLARISA